MDRGRETGNLVFMKDAVQNRSDWAEEGRLWKVYEKEKKIVVLPVLFSKIGMYKYGNGIRNRCIRRLLYYHIYICIYVHMHRNTQKLATDHPINI